MAEDGEIAKSKRSFKSKWGRVFKEKESHEIPAGAAAQHTNSFKLNEDVADFLKPSTEKAATRQANLAPKIDIAIAQRFPEKQHHATGTPRGLNGFIKPTRRPGLQVGFAKTVPEVMGEGGDECLEPVVEIGKRKAVRGRSVSHAGQMIPAMAGVAAAAMARQGSGREEVEVGSFGKPPVRRTQTSGEEYAQLVPRPVYAALEGGEEEEAVGRRPSRTATGLGVGSDARFSPTGEADSPGIPRIMTEFSGSLRESLPSAKSPAFGESADRRRSLRVSEGMALRRASALIADGNTDCENRRTSMNFGVKPPPELYETLSREDAEEVMPEVPESATSPQSARSLTGASPFADPKYIERHSSENTRPHDGRIPQQPVQSAPRQQREAYQPSYMRAVPPVPASTAVQYQPPDPQSRPPIPRVDPPSGSDEDVLHPGFRQPPPPTHNFSRNSRPPIPQVQHHPEDDLADPRFQPPAMHEPAVSQPATRQTQRMDVPQVSLTDRSRSPFGDGIFDDFGKGKPTEAVYNQPNISNASLQRPTPSPRFSHSQHNSHDSTAARLAASDADHRQRMSPRFQQQSQSPHGSPRSSTFAHSGGPSPYGRAPVSGAGSQEYFSAPSAHSTQPPRSPAYPQYAQGMSQPDSSRSTPPPFAAPPRSESPTSRLPVFRNRQSGSRPSSQASFGSPQSGYFPSGNAGAAPPSRAAAGHLSEVDAQRPGSSSSIAARPAISPQPPVEGNPQADLAFADFASRVAHMKGVFRLIAEKERPADTCIPNNWLRTALWWYGRGKAGLEILLQQRSRDSQARERLEQPHVDLAKAWWILTDPLEQYDDLEEHTAPTAASGRSPDLLLKSSVVSLKGHLKSLSLSMSKNQLMPPPQSLIQGQDTQIWLEYPRFAPDAAAALGGISARHGQDTAGFAPLHALPLSDSRDAFCYGRFLVDVSMSTDEAETDRASIVCTLTMTRGKRDFPITMMIASQSELVNVKVGAQQAKDGTVGWQDVAWKGQSSTIRIRLQRGFELTVRMHERDFRQLWNLAEYARKVEHNLKTAPDETLVHEARLAEIQYVDSSGSNAFPAGKVSNALALVFEKHADERDGSGSRKVHRGHRIVLLTEPSHKSLSSVTHDVGTNGPIVFEMLTDSAAGGMAALVLRVREEQRQCRALLVFPDVHKRQAFYDTLNGLTVGREEQIVGKMSLASFNIEPATTFEGFPQQLHPALKTLQWQKLGITNGIPEDSHARQMPTVMSESLRLLARHATGCITDRLNLSKGELLLRLPCNEMPAIQLMRNPQYDLTISIDQRHSAPNVPEHLAQLYDDIRHEPTIRTLHFTTHADLHAFQEAITGHAVRYDGLAAAFGIKRRMMYVPIHQKWEASTVRVQVVAHGAGFVQVLAFMEGFAHADAMCFQVKSTDTFENVKGDGKGKKWAVRLVEAKFSLPPALEKEKREKDKEGVEVPPRPLEGEALEARVRRRFVNLEGLEYMGEHDDITVGFETQEERDRFAAALPGEATMSRGITLKRRI